jgi:hypothetical protein
MIDNELIAGKIEEVIGQMFSEFRSFEPKVSEYCIFYDPQKHASWFILIFFADINQLRDGLKSGFCYQIHSFLTSELNKDDEISNIGQSIFFESGNRPTGKNEIDNLFGKLLVKMEGLQMTAGKADVKICGSCGHDFDKHQMLFLNDSGNIDITAEGWMICPEENCNCFGTWDTNFNTNDKLNDIKKENRIKQAFKKLFK